MSQVPGDITSLGSSLDVICESLHSEGLTLCKPGTMITAFYFFGLVKCLRVVLPGRLFFGEK